MNRGAFESSEMAGRVTNTPHASIFKKVARIDQLLVNECDHFHSERERSMTAHSTAGNIHPVGVAWKRRKRGRHGFGGPIYRKSHGGPSRLATCDHGEK